MMGEPFKDNLIYKIIAILLAVLLWFYVSADQNPPVEKNLNLTVSHENLRDDLTLTSKAPSVNIKISGDQKVVSGLGLKDFQAVLDLSQVKMGEQSVPVKISNPLGIEIKEIYPKEVVVNIDKISEKQVPVKVALLGQTAHGYSSFKASVKPSQVVIRGPGKILESLTEARADVNLNSAQSNLVLNLPIKVQDRWGNWYGSDTLKIIPNTVEVFIPIIQDTPNKTVPVKPVFEGKPADGFQIARILVEPETVKILGPFNKLDTIDRVQTLPISLAGAKENIIQEIDLSVPSGVTLLYGTKVKVMVQVEEGSVKKSFDIQIKVHNGKSTQRIVLAADKAKIMVEGKNEVVSKLTEKDIQAFVDVAGLEIGTHELEIHADAPSDVQVLQVEPIKLKVEIKPQEDKPSTQAGEISQ
ncbi:MAG: YbbR-like domain-containing protein [Bacillota bacterium]